ncbi:MAG: tyrosine--tRNA ligase [Bacteroidia bacterium]
MNLVEELRWRGLLQDIMPGTEELLAKEPVTGYIGFDPTSHSLHIGNLVPIMLLMHLQRHGHKPVALVGGATGMIGDPSGKSEERNLLSEEMLRKNQQGIRSQLSRFLDFEKGDNAAILVNNYDWMSGFGFLDFLRDVGKHLSVNYMMAKDSVKKRLETGISFTEFSYQLVQAYDFLHLFRTQNCSLQMGGSDQWGNMTTGAELIRRTIGGEAFALTAPLVTKADGSKFGKTEQGNVWLDPELTSPYAFYQFWMNTSDEDANRYIRIFTFLSQEEIESLASAHSVAPHQRLLQRKLAEEVTQLVHGTEELHQAQKATELLFGRGGAEMLRDLNPRTLFSALEGVPQYQVQQQQISGGISITDLLTDLSTIFPSKGEARRFIKNGGLILNKEKINDPEMQVNEAHFIQNSYVMVQKGKKNYFLIRLN